MNFRPARGAPVIRDEVQAVLVADARSVTCVILGALK